MTRRGSSTTVTPILVLPAIQRRRRVARCVALLAVLFAAPARADVLVDFDFQFTPRNHPTTPTATMPGWGSAVIRLFSTSGPILSVDFEPPISPEISRGIYGRLGQRWNSPGGNGVYTTTSPGPVNIANGRNDLSLDSHFLGEGE